MNSEFVVFILTYARPNAQITYNTLKRCGYTGKVYLILDDTDTTIQQYIDNYGAENIIVFNKNYYINSDRFDNGTNKPVYASAVYARRAIEDIAKSMCLDYFAMADDDIQNLVIRYPLNNKLVRAKITNLDTILCLYTDLLTQNVACVGFGMNRSYFGGVSAFCPERLCKKIMPSNFFIRNASVKVNWVAWTFEDDITHYCNLVDGNVWLSIPYVQQILQPFADVNNTGGNVDLYKTRNHFDICFTEVQYMPSAIKVKCDDIHNLSDIANTSVVRAQNNCFQKLISDGYRKEK